MISGATVCNLLVMQTARTLTVSIESPFLLTFVSSLSAGSFVVIAPRVVRIQTTVESTQLLNDDMPALE